MNESQEEINKIYQSIIDLMWSIFPEDAIEVYFYAQVFDDFNERTFDWLNKDGNISWHEFGDSPTELFEELIIQLKLLQDHKLFEKEKWTHCIVTVTDDYKLNMKYAYISKENTSSGLYMRGVSELSYEESEKFYIQKEEWERLREKFKI